MSSTNDSVALTPTKRSHPDELDPTNLMSSPKFIKPCDVFRKRAKRSHKSPVKSQSSSKRCVLPLETVVRKKNYSPLKCLQTFNVSLKNGNNNNSPTKNKSEAAAKRLTFSPLMKKLQRSPVRSSLQFPVVKRSNNTLPTSASKESGTLKRSLNSNTFSRVLNFSEDANFFPDKFESSFSTSPSKTSSSSFHPLNAPNIDWSLKKRLRLITNRSVPFHGNFKAIDEATGLSHFVHGMNSKNSTVEKDNFAAELQRHSLVWQHPSLPWIKLFPRTPDLKPGAQLSSTTPVFSISANSTLADSLHSSFCVSLHSLFKMLKAKHCPYFYLCANNFTALFRASGVSGADEAHALISPTTHGFRKLLKDESIDYTMPFHQETPSSPNMDSSSSDTSASSGIGTSESSELTEESFELIDESPDNINPDESDEWLESLGLSQQDFPSLESATLRRRRVMKSKSSFKRNSSELDDQSAEGKMKSVVRVNGIMNCQTLISLFLNMRKICVSNSGPLSGIPPTLLSPVAFHGATLTPVTIKSSVTQKSSFDDPTHSHNLVSIDVIGPILPHTVYGLMNLFGRHCSTSLGSNLTLVRSSLQTYDQSSPFSLEIGQHQKNNSSTAPSTALEVNPTFAVENLEETAMDKRFLTAICTPERQLTVPLADFELTPNGIRYNRTVYGSKRH